MKVFSLVIGLIAFCPPSFAEHGSPPSAGPGRPTATAPANPFPNPTLDLPPISSRVETERFTFEQFFVRNMHPLLHCSSRLPGENPHDQLVEARLTMSLNGAAAALANHINELYRRVEYFQRNRDAGTELAELLTDARAQVNQNLQPDNAEQCLMNLQVSILQELTDTRRYLQEHQWQMPEGFSPRFLISSRLAYNHLAAEMRFRNPPLGALRADPVGRALRLYAEEARGRRYQNVLGINP